MVALVLPGPSGGLIIGARQVSTTFDPANTSANITLSNGNLTIISNSANAAGDSSRSIAHHSSGVYYNETIVDAAAGTTNCAPGVCNAGFDLTNFGLGTGESAGYFNDGNIYGNGVSLLNPVPTYTTGDRLGVEIDVTNQTMRVRKNGGSWSSTVSLSYITGDFYFAGYVFFFGVGAQLTTNFGATAYVDTPPIGASNW